MKPELQVWKNALDGYRYPVDLCEYRFRIEHKGWFERTTGKGGREETIAFEEHFRRHASERLEAWFEVVFWKLASQPQIRNGTTHRIATYLSNNITAKVLWDKCLEYVRSQAEEEYRARFKAFHKLFGLGTDRIAVVATFPAFIDPDRFPMVDKRIAEWVGKAMDEYNRSDSQGVQLVRPRFLDTSTTSLTMSDLGFMTVWVSWCQDTAQKLTRLDDGFHWRARDVEMAIFRAQEKPQIGLLPVPRI